MANSFRIKFRREYFLFLLPLFFVLHNCQENFPLIPIKDAFILLIEYELITLIIVGLCFFLFRSWNKALLFSFFLMCIQFFFGSFQDITKRVFPNVFLSRYTTLLSLILVSIFFGFIFLKKTKRQFTNLKIYLNTTFLLLLIIDSFILAYKALDTNKRDEPLDFFLCTSCNRPNIYFILTDEYAGKKELKDLFAFDN